MWSPTNSFPQTSRTRPPLLSPALGFALAGLGGSLTGSCINALVTGTLPTLTVIMPKVESRKHFSKSGEASVSGKLWGSGRVEEGAGSPALSRGQLQSLRPRKEAEGGLGQGGGATKLVGWGSQAQEPLRARSAEAPVRHQLRSPASGAGPLLLSCHQGPTSRSPLTAWTKPAPTNNK